MFDIFAFTVFLILPLAIRISMYALALRVCDVCVGLVRGQALYIIVI